MHRNLIFAGSIPLNSGALYKRAAATQVDRLKQRERRAAPGASQVSVL